MRADPKIFFRYLSLLAICAGLSGAGVALGQSIDTWTNAAGNHYVGTSANWTNSSGAQVTPAASDTLRWIGATANNPQLITNDVAEGSPGVSVNLTAGQVNPVTIYGSSNMRFVSINVASGAGALTYNGNTGGNPYMGNDYAHYWTNNSSSTVSFLNSSWQSGGGGNHELDLYGTGNWLFGNNIQFTNSGASNLSMYGSGSVTLNGTNNGTFYGGSAGTITVNSGTLVFGGTNALYGTSALTLAGGNLDCSLANLVNANVNPQNWNGDFTFVGSQNMNLGTGAVTLGGNRQVTVSANTLTVGGVIGGSYSLTKAGNGTLTLSGANIYTGNTTINAGTLALSGGSINNSPNITVSNGATFDVSGVAGYTLGGSQILYGSGTVNGSFNTTSGSKIYADNGVAGVYGTNTYNNNLTNVSGATVYMNLGDAYNGTNDQIVVGGTLALNSTVFHLRAPGTSDYLDFAHNYILARAASVTGSASAVFDVAPFNNSYFSVVVTSTNVQLHCTPAAPTLTATASPSPALRNQNVTIAATVTAGSAPVTNVTVNLSAIGGGTGTLVQSNSSSLYTNTFTMAPSTAADNYNLTVTAMDQTPLTGSNTAALTVNVSIDTWTNAAGDHYVDTSANWTNSTGAQVTPAAGDTLQWIGTTANNPQLITNNTTFGPPGVNLNLTSGQVNPVTIYLNSDFRIGPALSVSSGAGALTFSGVNGGNLYIGNDYYHYWTNNSASTVSFLNSSWQSGGGGNHELDLYGSGNWLFGNSIQFTNAGSGGNLYLNLNGTGAVTLDGTNNGSVYAGGSSGAVTVNSGTLVFGGTNALYGTSTLTLAGGNLDCSLANLVNGNVNPENWNSDFTFVGSQSLNLGPGAVTLGGNRQVTVSTNTLTVGGAIGGGYSLTKAGAGNLTLSGHNTYSGGTVVSGGTLALAVGGSSACVLGTLTINSGALVSLGAQDALGYGAVASPVNIVGGTLDNSTSTNNGWITTFNLTGGTMSSTGGGGYNFNGSSSAINSLATNIVSTISGPVVLRTNGVVITTAAGTVPSGIDLNISGAISDGGSGYNLTKAGPGALALSGTNTYTGGTVVNAGTLSISGSGSLGAGSYSGAISNGGTMTFSSSVAQTLDGPISGSGLLQVSGSTVTLSGTNTFSGQTKVVGGGVLNVSSVSKALGNVSDINLGGSWANGTLFYTGTGETSDRVISYTAANGSDYEPNQVIDQSGSGLLKFTGSLSQGGVRAHYLILQGSTSGAGEIAGNISGSGGATTIVKNGTGTWTLSGNNAYTGGTVVNAGTLVVSNAAALGAAANLLTLASNATSVVLQVAANLTSPQATTLSGGADGASGTGSVIVDTLTNRTAQLQMNPSAGPAFPGLIVRDQGLLVLSGTNTFNYFFAGNSSLGGNLLITNGSFVVFQNNGNSKFDQGANVTIGSNAVFAVGSGNGGAWFPLGDTAGTTNNMTIAGGSFIVTNNYGFQVARNGDAALTINSGSVLVNDTGTLGLSMSEGNGHSTLNLNGGRLTPLLFRFGGGMEVINFNGGTLAASASRTDFLPSSGETANVRNGGAVVDSAGFNITISQPLVHSGIAGDNAVDGGLTKLNSGTLTLSGANTYTGGTVVNAGTLALSNTGSISNSANIFLAASGTFDVSAVSTFNLSSNTVLQARGTGTAPGSTAATINGGGTVNLNTNSIILNFTPVSFSGDTTHPALLVTNASLTLNNNGITITNAAATPLGAGVYRLVQVGNGSSGSISGTPNATPVVVSGSGIAAGTTASISVSSGNLNLTVQNVTTNTLALTSGSNPSTYGNSVTFSATISPAPTNGESVTFKDGATTLGTGTISAGVAAFSISTLAYGSHSITAVYAGDVTNTASTSAALAFNVNQAVVTVASGITANSKTYNGTTTATINSNSVVLSGVVAGDSGNVVLSTNGYGATFSSAAVGTGKTVTVSGLTLTGSAASNYTLTPPTGLTANITAATLTVTANSTNRVYGAANPTFTGSVTGQQNGDSITATFTTTAGTNSPVGSYTITPVLSDPGNKLGNYTVTTNAGTLTVTAAALTVTANNTNRIYGVSNPSLTASYSGFVNGETASVVLGTPGFSTSATNSSPVGSYVITPLVGSLTATNYSFTVFNNGSLTITKASSTNVVSSSSNPAPTGSNVTFTATLTAVGPASGTPTGAVQFLADGTALGAPATLSGGIASLTTNSLSHGTHVITAQYAGDGNFAGSTNTLGSNQAINSAPIAGSDTLQRYPTTGAKMRVTSLLANDTDADGDAISLISVNAASAQGGTVTTNYGWVFYTRPAGYTNADSFTYVITDGSLQATGSVTVAIVSDTNAAQNTELSQNLGNGSLLTSFFGIPGRTYTIQYTTNLATPNWQSLGTAAADATGQFQYTDSPGTNLPARFYRSTYP